MNRNRLFSSALALAAAALLAVPAGASVAVIINEIDYDQPGTDTAEWVELRNLTGAPAPLDGYELAHINQSCLDQHVTDLTGITIPAGGYVVIGNHPCAVTAGAFPAENALQNGPGDAVALRETVSGLIVSSVEYEDAGSGCVSEATSAGDNNTDADSSIHLCNGVWEYFIGSTPCAPNACPVSVDGSSWGSVKGLYR